MIAFFTLMLFDNITSIFMFAIMSFSKVRNSLINLSFSDHIVLRSIASDHLICSSYETIFVSLITRTNFSALFANIVTMISMLWGKTKERDIRIVHCRDSCSSRQWTFNQLYSCENVHHVITFNVKFNESSTTITSLSLLFPRSLEYLLSRSVLRTIVVVWITLANSASICVADDADCSLVINVYWSDKEWTCWLRTISSIRGIELNALLLECVNQFRTQIQLNRC